MFLRTLLFLAAVYVILYFLIKSLRAFFRQLGRQDPKPKMPEPKETPILHIRKEDIEDAKFEDLPKDLDQTDANSKDNKK